MPSAPTGAAVESTACFQHIHQCTSMSQSCDLNPVTRLLSNFSLFDSHFFLTCVDYANECITLSENPRCCYRLPNIGLFATVAHVERRMTARRFPIDCLNRLLGAQSHNWIDIQRAARSDPASHQRNHRKQHTHDGKAERIVLANAIHLARYQPC